MLRYFFGDDKRATLFRDNIQGLNRLHAICSKMVRPLKKNTHWKESVKFDRCIKIKHGEIVHRFTPNVIPDKKYDIDNVKLGYMEDYFMDEQSQLEKRIVVGDSSFMEQLKDDDRKIMIGNSNKICLM